MYVRACVLINKALLLHIHIDGGGELIQTLCNVCFSTGNERTLGGLINISKWITK